MLLKKLLPASLLALSCGFAHAHIDESMPVLSVPAKVSEDTIKQHLRTKLDLFEGFSSNFVQNVQDADGNELQTTQGKLVVKRPNLIYWQTTAPDETLVVSDGKTLWFYNPFVEQVSAYSVSSAVVNTPILLLSDTSAETWQQYNVEQLTNEQFLIHAKNEEAQVKTLQLNFEKQTLVKFSIVDATGQVSHFNLSDVVTSPAPDASQFQFTMPQGIDLDDQR